MFPDIHEYFFAGISQSAPKLGASPLISNQGPGSFNPPHLFRPETRRIRAGSSESSERFFPFRRPQPWAINRIRKLLLRTKVERPIDRSGKGICRGVIGKSTHPRFAHVSQHIQWGWSICRTMVFSEPCHHDASAVVVWQRTRKQRRQIVKLWNNAQRRFVPPFHGERSEFVTCSQPIRIVLKQGLASVRGKLAYRLPEITNFDSTSVHTTSVIAEGGIFSNSSSDWTEGVGLINRSRSRSHSSTTRMLASVLSWMLPPLSNA
jgi:hypothetical protein